MWQQDITLTDDGNKLWENSCETVGNTGRKKLLLSHRDRHSVCTKTVQKLKTAEQR